MNKLLLPALFSLFAYFSWGQTTLTGSIFSAADTTALPGTSVSILDTYIGTYTDLEGNFILKDIPAGPCTLYVSCMGFQKLKAPMEISGKEMNLGTIMLQESYIDLDEILVTAIAPMVMQLGDTTQYNASAFQTNPDADAEELVAKIPGVILDEGQIEAQGEPIMKVYVDGEPFFFDDPLAALKNLPASVIQNIQIFDDMSDQAKFTGFDDGERVRAINIVTKGRAKSTTLLKTELSGGADISENPLARYLAGGNFSHFSKKHRITLTGLSNNINTSQFKQGENTTMDDNGNVINQSAGVKTLNNYGLNYTYTGNKLKLTAGYTFNDNNTSVLRDSYSYNTSGMGNMAGREDYTYSDSYSWSTSHRANLRVEWKMTDRNTFVWTPQVSFTKSGNDPYLRTLYIKYGTPTQRSLIWTPSETDRYSISGNALLTHRFSMPGRSLSLNFNYSISDSDVEQYRHTIYRDNYNKSKSDWNLGTNVARRTTTDNWGNVMRLKLTYTQPLGKGHNLSANLIGSTNQGIYNKQVYTFKEADNDYTVKPNRLSNYFDRDYSSFGGNIGYMYKDSLYTINANLDYMRLYQNRNQFEPRPILNKQEFNTFEPLVSLRYTVDKGRFVRFEYSGSTLLPDIQYMGSVINDASPNNLQLGNPDLKPGYEHSGLFLFTSSNTEKSRTFSFTLSAKTISDYVTTKTTLAGDSIVLNNGDVFYPENPQNALLIERINLNGYFSGRVASTYGFAVRPLKSNVNISAGYSFIRNPSIYGIMSYANSHITNMRLGITSNISEKIDFSAFYNASLRKNYNTTRKNTTYFQQTFFLSANIIFWKDLVFNTSFRWKYYDSKTSKHQYNYVFIENYRFVYVLGDARNPGRDYSENQFLLNVSLGKKFLPKKNLEVRLTVSDLFNETGGIQHTIKTNSVEDIRTNTLGRYFMLRVMFNFNSLTHGKNAKQAQQNNRYNSVQYYRQGQANGQQNKQGQNRQWQNAPNRQNGTQNPNATNRNWQQNRQGAGTTGTYNRNNTQSQNNSTKQQTAIKSK